MLYRITWTEYGEEYSRIDRTDSLDNYDVSHGAVAVEVPVADIEMDELVAYVVSELENANYHSMEDMPGNVAGVLLDELPAGEAKRIMYALVDHGVFAIY